VNKVDEKLVDDKEMEQTKVNTKNMTGKIKKKKLSRNLKRALKGKIPSYGRRYKKPCKLVNFLCCRIFLDFSRIFYISKGISRDLFCSSLMVGLSHGYKNCYHLMLMSGLISSRAVGDHT